MLGPPGCRDRRRKWWYNKGLVVVVDVDGIIGMEFVDYCCCDYGIFFFESLIIIASLLS